MLLPFKNYYRERGIRQAADLTAPIVLPFTTFSRSAMLHNLTFDDQVMFDPTQLYFSKYNKRIPFTQVYQSNVMTSDARPVAYTPREQGVKFAQKHREFRYDQDGATHDQDGQTLVLVNYNSLKDAYRFPNTNVTAYHRWLSFERTRVAKIKEIAEFSNREHFIFFPPVDDVPAPSVFRDFGDKDGVMMGRVFDTPGRLMALQVWKLIHTDQKVPSIFAELEPKTLSRVNLVMSMADGRAALLNLGYLHSFIKGNENITDRRNLTQGDPTLIGRLFLRLLMVVNAKAPDSLEELQENPTPGDEEQDGSGEDPDTQTSSPEKVDGSSPETGKSFVQKANLAAQDDDVRGNLIEELKDLNDDMEALEYASKISMANKGLGARPDLKPAVLPDQPVIPDLVADQPNEPVLPKPPTFTRAELFQKLWGSEHPNERAQSILDKRLRDGSLTPLEFRKAVKDIDIYKEMANPYGGQHPVVHMVKPPGEAIKIKKDEIQIKDAPTVFDKTMLETSTKAFTATYVKERLHADTLRMIGAVQQGGVAIKSHEVDIDRSALGVSEIHRIELKPIDGQSSPIWLRIPKVDEDGVFVTGSNRYLMRKQRVDLPIRKINPTEVALSSYYGKSFVQTASKRANSTVGFVIAQINKAAMSASDGEWVTNVVPGNTFDSYRIAPYYYNALSTEFVSFKAGDVSFFFDGRTPKMIWPSNIKELEKKGGRWIGEKPAKGDKPRIDVFMDMENRIHALSSNGLQEVGDIFTILRLDPHRAPIQYSELRIFRKTIPVALVLGYLMGWDALMVLMDAKYRIVPARKSLGLEPHEYPVSFRDVTYVFSTKDRLTTMVVSGFLEYAKTIRSYDKEQFEHPDVYLNLFSSRQLTPIYIKEIDMLMDYFIDPITLDILKEMKEPQSFDGLLLRSSELLLSYDHPKPQDTKYTRDRGYERFPGIVYKELTQAIRQYRNKNISGRSKITMSTWKVAQTIAQDPAVMLVADTNPLNDLKHQDSVTFVGVGGRDKGAINKSSRAYSESSPGVSSEASVDSSDVGVNVYLTANPQIQDLYGRHKQEKTLDPTSMFSSCSMASPGVVRDD